LKNRGIGVLENSVKNTTSVTVIVEFMAICPVSDNPYSGTMEIKYTPNEKLLEWDSFATWVKGLRKETILAEELAEYVIDTLGTILVPLHIQIKLCIRSAFHLPVEIMQEKTLSERDNIKL